MKGALAIVVIAFVVVPVAQARGIQRFLVTTGPNAAECEIDVAMPALGTSVFCLVVPSPSKARSATLSGKGKVTTCSGVPCVANGPDENPYTTLRPGHALTVGPFRCSALRSGIRCVLTKTGHGFLLSRIRVTRV